jgi:hypothetical protein
MADLERLTILIEANTRQITRQLKTLERDIDKSMRTSARSVNTLNKSLATATRTAKTFATAFGVGFLTGGLAQLPGALQDVVESVADLGDQADKIGITAEQLQELNFQAEQTGSSAEAMAASLEQFSKRLAEARTGSGELYKLLLANGVALDDLAKMDVNEALRVFVDILGNAKDQADALKIATIGGGKAATDWALTFRDGSDAMREFADQAHRTAQIITNETVESAKELDDKFKLVLGTISQIVKSGVVDAFSDIADEIDRINGLIETLQNFGRRVRSQPSPFSSTVEEFEEYAKVGQRVDEAFAGIGEQQRDAELRRALERKLSIAPGGDEGLGTPSVLPAAIKERSKAREEETQTIKRQIPVIEELNAVVEEENLAQEQLIDTLDEIRFAAGSALDAFAQSIANAQGPLEALKAGLADVLQTIIRIAEQQAITRLFGGFGTAGGGILGGLLGAAPGIGSVAPARAASSQAVAVHVTATPSPLLNLTITQSSQAAEERAIARGPVVARNNSLRYAVP